MEEKLSWKNAKNVKTNLIVFVVALLFLPIGFASADACSGFSANASFSPLISTAGFSQPYTLSVTNTRTSGTATIKKVGLYVANYNASTVYNVTSISDPTGWTHAITMNGSLIGYIEWNTMPGYDGIPVGQTKNFSFIATVPSTGTRFYWKLMPQSQSCPVEVITQTRILSRVEVTPNPATVNVSTSRIFTAQGYDSLNATLDGVTYSWTTNVGSIVSTGEKTANFTAQSTPATGIVTATYQSVSGHADVYVVHGSLNYVKILSANSCNASEVGNVSLTADQTRTLYAYGFDSYNNCLGPEIVSWSITTSSGSGIGGVSPSSGTSTVFTAQHAGTGVVTATVAGALPDSTETITVTHGTATGLDVTPHSATVTADGNVTYSATASDSDGNTWNVTANTTFTENDPLGSFTANIYYAGQVGIWEVNGTYGSLYAKAVVTVSEGVLDSISVECVPNVVELQQTGQCTASCFDADGNQLESCNPAWSSNSSAVVIYSNGTFYGATTGSSTINATSGSVSGYDAVQVTEGSAASVVVSPPSANLEFGETQQFTASCFNQHAAEISCGTVAWSVVNGGGSINASGFFTAGATEETVADTVEAVAGSASGYASVTIVPGAVVSITVLPSSATVYFGNDQQFNATCENAYAATIPCAGIAWQTDVGTVNGTGLFTAQSTPDVGTVNASVGTVFDYADVTVESGCNYTTWQNDACVANGTMRQNRTDNSHYAYCTELEQNVSNSVCDCVISQNTTCVSNGYANVTYAWNYGYCGSGYTQTVVYHACDSNYVCDAWHNVENGYVDGCVRHHWSNQTRRCTDQYGTYYDQFREVENGVCDCLYTNFTDVQCVSNGTMQQTRQQTSAFDYCTELTREVSDSQCDCRQSNSLLECVSDGFGLHGYSWNYGYCGVNYTQEELDLACNSNYSCGEWTPVESQYNGCLEEGIVNLTRTCTDQYNNSYFEYVTNESETCLCQYSEWQNAGCVALGLMNQSRIDGSGFEYCTDLTHNVEDAVCACTPGDEQNQTGNCSFGGFQTRVCAQDYSWGAWGSCQNEGQCAPNSTETQSCGNGGSQTRTCTSNYTWGSWGDCTGSVVYSGGGYVAPSPTPTPMPTPKPSVVPSEQPPAPSPSPRPTMGNFDVTTPTPKPSALPLGETPAPITGLFAFANSACVGALLLLAIIAGALAYYAAQKKKILAAPLWLAVAVMFLIPFGIALLLNDSCPAINYALGEDVILAILAFAVKKKML